jgi:Tol biopolymer transport system component
MFSRWFGSSTRRGGSTRIAFERTGEDVPGCPRGIYTVNPNGSDLRHIRPSGQSPRWSPDGRWIAFSEATRDTKGLQSIFVMRPDGADVRQLTHHNDVDATPPCWSPDSRRLAYSLWLWSEKRYELCVVEVATKQWKHLLYTEDAIYPVWAPSDRIMFTMSRDDAGPRLFEVDSSGKQFRQAPLFEPGDSEPVWTPDGKRVVFGRNGGLGVADTGTGKTHMINTEGTAIQWAISPDGESVAYAAQETGSVAGFEIFVLGLNEQTKRKLVSNPIVDDHEVDSRYVSWSPLL